MRWIDAAAAAGIALAAVALVAANLQQEQSRIAARAVALTGGSPGRGAQRLAVLGCAGCHEVPGVTGATGLTGPSLAEFGRRVFIAGRLRNTPENLMRWIRDPHSVDPHSAMPDVGATAADARDIAAYLYTLD
jgi:cytochrome c2